MTSRDSFAASAVLIAVMSLSMEAVPAASHENTAVARTTDDTRITVPSTRSTEEARGVHPQQTTDIWSMLFVLVLATFIGIGAIARVSRLLHTPLMSLTNAISAIAVVGAIIVTGTEGYPAHIRFLGAIALFASTTNIVSGFLITDRMLKMFKQTRSEGKR